MGRSRDKVAQIGLWDEQVVRPEHDAICLWAYSHALAIAREVLPSAFARGWEPGDVDYVGFDRVPGRADAARELAEAFQRANTRPEPRVHSRSLECVLTSHTGYRDAYQKIVGYADLVVQLALPVVVAQWERRPEGEVLQGFTIGWRSDADRYTLVVEAKSQMPTVGELLRQINLYRTAMHGSYVVVAPDCNYTEVLREQGVAFVRYLG
jgi:hypothetical protein